MLVVVLCMMLQLVWWRWSGDTVSGSSGLGGGAGAASLPPPAPELHQHQDSETVRWWPRSVATVMPCGMHSGQYWLVAGSEIMRPGAFMKNYSLRGPVANAKIKIVVCLCDNKGGRVASECR